MSLSSAMSTALAGTAFNADINPAAKAATYTPKGGTGAALTAIIQFGEDLSERGYREVKYAHATIFVKAADVASPGVYDTVLISGTTWTVDMIVDGDGLVWELSAHSDMRQTLGA